MRFLGRAVLVAVVAALVLVLSYGVGTASRQDEAPAAQPGQPEQTGQTGQPGQAEQPAPPARPAAEPRPTLTPDPEPTPEPEPELVPGPALLAPGDEGDEVRELQARLAQIDWFDAGVTGYYGEVTTAAVRGFQAKRGIPVTGEVDGRTRARLLAMTTEPTDAELHGGTGATNTPGALDPRCLGGRVLCVDKSSNTLRWVVDGEVGLSVDVRFGGSSTPTREGVFSVYRISRDHVSSLYGSAMPYAMFFSGGQAVHYSSDFAAVGYAGASHGCVNVRDHDAIAWLFDQVRVGDRVVVYWS